jgi:hypothetical protein
VVGIATQRAIALGPAANEAFARSTGPWAVLAAVIGRRSPNIRTAVISATVVLWSATVAFYAVGGPPGNGGTPGLWLAAIVIIGPALGWLGKTSAATGAARGPKRIVAATLIPMTAAPAVSLTAAGLLLSTPLH